MLLKYAKFRIQLYNYRPLQSNSPAAFCVLVNNCFLKAHSRIIYLMLENKLITDLLPLINGFNNHVTVELTYTSCAYSTCTNDEIQESNVSANRTGTKKGNVWRSQDCLCLYRCWSAVLSGNCKWYSTIFASSVINLCHLPLISTNPNTVFR